ncbi:MAG TPA: hypothetical protein VM262_19835 [Acidimicrobiales bacterium]|nr:hypothetical protein [Acidimicrobiales bacterium]
MSDDFPDLAEIVDELDWSRLPAILRAVLSGQDDAVLDAFVAGELAGAVTVEPFDAEGYATVLLHGSPIGSFHYGRLWREFPLDLANDPPRRFE